MAKMKSSDLVAKAIDIAKNYSTLYVMGCFGAPLTGSNVTRYCNNHDYNKQADRTAMIKAAADKTPPVFGFDCVNLIKAILWGWTGAANKTYGGAIYKANGVPDIGADQMIAVCSGVSTTGWASMVPGEAVWTTGHIGIYIGDGLAVECTPAFANKVQITAVSNIGAKTGYNARTWKKHGKIPYVDYGTAAATTPTTPSGASTGSVKVGDVVDFTGTTHFSSANATTGKACKPGKAKVTQVYNGKHPYHLVTVSGGGSNVYGWVNAADIGKAQEVTAGSTVTIKAGAVYGGLSSTKGTKVPSSITGTRKYTVQQIATHNGAQEALLKEINSWVAISYLSVV